MTGRRNGRKGWTEPQYLKNGPTWHRARYYDAEGNKADVRDEHGKIIHFARKSDGVVAATAAYDRCHGAADNAPVANATITWGEWWDLHVAPGRQDFISQTPYRERRAVELLLRPRWGDVPLNRINWNDIQEWVDQTLAPGRQPPTVRKYFQPFVLSLRSAVKQNVLIGSPPTDMVTLPVCRTVRHKNSIDLALMPDILAALERGYDQFFEFGFWTGLRPGELAGIHLDDLERSHSRLWVASVYVNEVNVIRSWPKNKHTRKVLIPSGRVHVSRAWDIVDKVLAGQRAPEACGIPHVLEEGGQPVPCPGALLFRNPEGHIIRPDTFRYYVKRALKRHGLPHTTPYALRRAYITALFDEDMSAEQIAALVGHADVRQTLQYIQQSPQTQENLDRIAEKITNRIFGGRDQTTPADTGQAA